VWFAPKTRIVTALEWANEYLDYALQFPNRTYRTKKAALTLFAEQYGPSRDIFLATPTDAYRILSMRLSVSGNAANKDRRDLRAAWRWGQKYMGLPDKNPFAEVEKFAEQRQPRYVPPEADFFAVLNSCTNEQDHAFLKFALYTSARLREICRLQWSDVEPGRVRLWTNKRKGGGLEFDYVPLVTPAAEALAGLKKQSTFVFVRENGERYLKRQHFMKRICKRAGVKHFGFHAIRHLSASILANENVPLPIIQGILRHKTSTTTSGYLKSLGVDLPVLENVWENRAVPVTKIVALRASKK